MAVSHYALNGIPENRFKKKIIIDTYIIDSSAKNHWKISTNKTSKVTQCERV